MMYAYKIAPLHVWFNQFPRFRGTVKDLKDGFIHLSPHDEVRRIAVTRFTHQSNLVLACIDLQKIEGELRFKGKFPHVYGTIPSTSIRWMWTLYPSPDGKDFVYPDVFDQEKRA
jgi:uncharacterized protein (DUF952 family)